MKPSAWLLPEARVISVPEKELNAVAGSYFNAPNNNLRRLYVKESLIGVQVIIEGGQVQNARIGRVYITS